MSDFKFCDSCGYKLSISAMFCSKCGQKQPELMPEPVPAPEKTEEPVNAQVSEENMPTIDEEQTDKSEPVTEGSPAAESGQADKITEPEQPQPAVQPQPVIQPQPTTQPQPAPQPQPAQQPQPMVQPQPTVQPKPQQVMQPQHQTQYYPQAVHINSAQPQDGSVKKKFPWIFTIVWFILFVAVGVWAYFLLISPNYDYPRFTEDAQRIALFTASIAALIYTLSLKLTMKKLKALPTVIMILLALAGFFFFCLVELQEGEFLHDAVVNIIESISP